MSNREKDLGTTTVLEPEVDKTQLAKDILFPKRAEKRREQELKKERELERLAEEQKTTTFQEKQTFFKPQEEIYEPQEELSVEPELEEVQEEELEEEETEQAEELEKKTAKIETLAKPKKSLKLRLKLIVAVYVAILVGFGSWAIYNAVDNNNLANRYGDLENVQDELKDKYVDKTKELEDLIKNLKKLNPDKIGDIAQNMEQAEIIELKPQELVEPTNFKQKSNWFDKRCNWVSGIFGG